MSPSCQEPHDTVLSLSPGLRESLVYVMVEGGVVLETASGHRYFLKRWQKDFLEMLDGQALLSEVVNRVEEAYPGEISSDAVELALDWLKEKNFLADGSSSLFEIDDEDELEEEALTSTDCADLPGDDVLSQWENSPFELDEEEDEWEVVGVGAQPAKTRRFSARPWLLGAAALLFGMAAFRLAYVTAPVMEPAIERFMTGRGDPQSRWEGTVASGSRQPSAPVVEEKSLAGMAAPVPSGEKSEEEERMRQLRAELAECRIRRDEFYLQNNEKGYRIEVEKMSELTREIGRIEIQRKQEL